MPKFLREGYFVTLLHFEVKEKILGALNLLAAQRYELTRSTRCRVQARRHYHRGLAHNIFEEVPVCFRATRKTEVRLFLNE